MKHKTVIWKLRVHFLALLQVFSKVSLFWAEKWAEVPLPSCKDAALHVWELQSLLVILLVLLHVLTKSDFTMLYLCVTNFIAWSLSPLGPCRDDRVQIEMASGDELDLRNILQKCYRLCCLTLYHHKPYSLWHSFLGKYCFLNYSYVSFCILRVSLTLSMYISLQRRLYCKRW